MMNPIAYQVEHVTVYRYNTPVLISFNQMHVKPRVSDFQRLVDYQALIHPMPFSLREQADFFQNPSHFFSIEESHSTLEVISRSVIEVTPRPEIPASAMMSWEENLQALSKETYFGVGQFRLDSPHVRRSENLGNYARTSFQKGRGFLEAVRDLNDRIFREFSFSPFSTTVTTSPEEVLVSRQGVCQDFAHLMIACLRSLGFAARYVSGYLETLPPPGVQKLVGSDASHAWVSVYFPRVGWIDFDPTNNQIPTYQHLTLAWGRDYSDVVPLRGVYLGTAAQTIEIRVNVQKSP